MRKISIHSPLAPFYSAPRVEFLIPATFLRVVALPASFGFFDARNEQELGGCSFELPRPAHHFRVTMNCVTGEVYCLAKGDRLHQVTTFKGVGGLSCQVKGVAGNRSFSFGEAPLGCSQGRLSLGMHKALDLYRVRERGEIREILPIWYALGSCLPPIQGEHEALPLIEEIEQAMHQKAHDKLQRLFLETFAVTFHSLLSPQGKGFQEWGYPWAEKDYSPLHFLQKSASLIRNLFVEWRASLLTLLPHLFSPLSAGRFLELPLSKTLFLDLEWSNKNVRTLILHNRSDREEEVCLTWPKGHTCRVNGKMQQAKTPFVVLPMSSFFCDRFEK